MFKIGNITLKNNVVLAPMAGVCNSAFRKIIKEMGCGLIYAEMVSDKAITHENQKTLDMLYMEEDERPIAQQIFGSDIESFVKAAKKIEQQMKPDIIDINMGCPVPKVALKAQAGSYLLKNPQKIYEIVSAVVNAVKVPVTVKIRSGWDSTHKRNWSSKNMPKSRSQCHHNTRSHQKPRIPRNSRLRHNKTSKRSSLNPSHRKRRHKNTTRRKKNVRLYKMRRHHDRKSNPRKPLDNKTNNNIPWKRNTNPTTNHKWKNSHVPQTPKISIKNQKRKSSSPRNEKPHCMVPKRNTKLNKHQRSMLQSNNSKTNNRNIR